jgi:predicted kinase
MPDVFVISGPPGSGKSSLVRSLIHEGELVFDLDRVRRSIVTEQYPGDIYSPATLTTVLAMRKAFINSINTGQVRTWIIDSAPVSEARDAYRNSLDAVCIVLVTPPGICLERINQDSKRDMRIDYESLVSQWWKAYTKSQDDIILDPNALNAVLDDISKLRPLNERRLMGDLPYRM